jgi:adenylylsulfate kinase-like enzyme
MILVLFGQPGSGKTTLSEEFKTHNIDGDKFRMIFNNKDYSKEGRIKNLNKASDIAHYLNNSINEARITLSLIYPYKEARNYLNSLSNEVFWVYLTYNEERGKESYHVNDFEIPLVNEVDLILNTSDNSLEECIKLIKEEMYKKHINNDKW